MLFKVARRNYQWLKANNLEYAPVKDEDDDVEMTPLPVLDWDNLNFDEIRELDLSYNADYHTSVS